MKIKEVSNLNSYMVKNTIKTDTKEDTKIQNTTPIKPITKDVIGATPLKPLAEDTFTKSDIKEADKKDIKK